MERRRKLGWIKIVKKSREFLWQSWKKTRGPLVIASKLESETDVTLSMLRIISSRFTPVFIEPFDELTTMLDFIRFHKRNLIVRRFL